MPASPFGILPLPRVNNLFTTLLPGMIMDVDAGRSSIRAGVQRGEDLGQVLFDGAPRFPAAYRAASFRRLGNRGLEGAARVARSELRSDVFHHSGDQLIAQRGDRFRGGVARPHARAAGGEDRVRAPLATLEDLAAQRFGVVGKQAAFDRRVPAAHGEELIEQLADPRAAAVGIFAGHGAVAERDDKASQGPRTVLTAIAAANGGRPAPPVRKGPRSA